MMFRERLKDLYERIEGTLAVSLVAHDGITVESFGGEEDLDLEALAAELLAQARSISAEYREIDVGELRQFSVTTDRYELLVGAVVEGYYLLLVLGSAGSYGKARFELRRATLRFEEDLL